MKSGIYCYENLINKKKYIGQAVNLSRRIREHKYYLSLGKDKAVALQRAIDKYGINNFSVQVLEYCEIEELNDKEIYYISQFHSNEKSFGYNLSAGGRSGLLGYKHSEETRKHISESKKGWKMSKGQIEFIRKLHTGKFVSLETRKKISEANTGEKHPMFGKTHSDESKDKMKSKKVGKQNYQFGTKLKGASSNFFGIHKIITKGYIYWVADIKINRKHVYIGSSKDEEASARMYDKYVIENNLPNPLNFPEERNLSGK